VLATCSPVDDLVCYRPGIGSCPVAGTGASVHEVGGTDALLAARLAAGDHLALAEVFDRLAPAVYSGALRVLGHDAAAQDVVQDVFVELWSHPGRYDPDAGSLRAYLTMQARHRRWTWFAASCAGWRGSSAAAGWSPGSRTFLLTIR
jgi:hypothetical protein